MARYRLLAVDIDGTLVNSRDELTTPTRNALVRAVESGIRVVIATGRRYSRTLHLVEPLGLDVPLITASGALVKHPSDHRTLYRAEFEPAVLRETLAIVAHAGYDPIVYADTFCLGFDFFQVTADTRSPQLAEYLRVNAGSGRVRADLVLNPPEGVFAGFTMGTREEMLALDRILRQRLGSRLTTHVLRSPKYTGYMCEVAPGGVTKWSGVRQLADQWQIGIEEICAVGDDVNDIPMIREAGLGIAMGNAQPEVKAAADRVAPTHDDDGLVSVVEWLLS